MARKNGKTERTTRTAATPSVPSHTKRAVIAIVLIITASFLTLAAFGIAGGAGEDIFRLFAYLLGVGYFLLPILLFLLAGSALRREWSGLTTTKLVASAAFVLSGLGFIALVNTKSGGLIGESIANPLVQYVDLYVSLLVLGGLSLISLLVLLEGSISVEPLLAIGRAARALLFGRGSKEDGIPEIDGLPLEEEEDTDVEEVYDEDVSVAVPATATAAPRGRTMPQTTLKNLLGEYSPPPLSLLERDKGRPGVGDIKANANIIKRTLANFGIVIELDEISIGPSVTRYAIKPAEGVRLQKIVALQTNLELALAAHPVRIEAPIPGKSLVGIEVPNSAKVTVGLGTLLESQEFAESQKPLLVALGRDIAGGSHFANISKMPHALIAGATGAGKSVTIHTLITSLLYRCSPQQLRFLMIDPKRVELTMYNQLPHLLTPVITDSKKAIIALRWAGKEMERRYNILEQKHVRDIGSYHENILAPELERIKKQGGAPEGREIPEAMPYIVIVVDEISSIMQAYPRELEACVVRLAQMSRAIGIHLILSTQRPEVNVITGLIKANVPARIALQVSSQIDSRTILDQGGAEKLLGAGDMLYLSGDMGKPIRLQSAFISEGEVKKITEYIAKNNEAELPIDIVGPAGSSGSNVSSGGSTGGGGGFGEDDEVDDDMYEAAKAAVQEAGKGSTSYIQRKLRVGYARAARLMDMLEERGVIGPQDGAKPREVLGSSGPQQSAQNEEVV